ncbi:hypothetical protein TBLA_0D03500 [Henningerozyma blattae CBS 6284]|uniref:CUE domain-containing protein n=1 Tax=Henningerozyma blattae (strain ATCC 34711 / CBS 6284 / DSM 70876 / NBRC 10599 / NRRL Y-10934 / UCD 77-7) TaxID=1071380 RepID=I2H398_HENB6|nr:hypothetical protein TBLA_0D03500 [Tetrapisispora blattae CBS 6284]CCH60850.1 hypothetical protein TBLA_0D03500 [Tetrapisispora blattae CBS 6284]
MSKVLEFNGNFEKSSYPIVKFPPLDLRAWLIEKDPVVWAHLLTTYVSFFEYLMQQDNIEHIDESTHDQLCLFVRNYLHEMAAEKGQVLALGENHDVDFQMNLLRTWIYYMIKKCGLLYLQLYGDSLWDLVKLYVDQNPDSVRSLLDGTLKPQINTQKAQLNRIHQIQQQLKHMVESGKFQRVDLKSFESLLNEKSSKNKGSHTNIKFAEDFLTATWMEVLESWWSKGKGRLKIYAQQLAIISLLSAPSSKIGSMLKELGVSNLDTLSLYPLLGTLLISEKFISKKPDLRNYIPFLNLLDDEDYFESENDDYDENNQIEEAPTANINQDDICTLCELFPDLTNYQISQLLLRYDGNVEVVSNIMFENPSISDDIPKEKPKNESENVLRTNNQKDMSQKLSKIAKNNKGNEAVGSFDSNSNMLNSIKGELRISSVVQRGKKKFDDNIINKHVPDEIKNRTMARALQLIYESDEDERDDTYDEADIGRGEAATAKHSKGSSNNSNVEVSDNEKKKQEEANSKYDQIEGYLWNLLKQDSKLFDRSQRGSKSRKSMKQQIGWSDEQIEGWARMLERSPKRAMLLEEKYMFSGNKKSGKSSFVQNRDGHIEEHINDKRYKGRRNIKIDPDNNKSTRDESSKKNKDLKNTGNTRNTTCNTGQNQKRQQAKNEKNKSSKANHNRKAQRDKKMVHSGQ